MENTGVEGLNSAAITAGAAFLTVDPQVMSGRLASGTTGADGITWRSVQ